MIQALAQQPHPRVPQRLAAPEACDSAVSGNDDSDRADQRLAQTAVDALRDGHHSPYVNVCVAVCAGRIHLVGQVRSWYAKQMAQERLKNLDGLKSLRNELEVVTGGN